MTAPSRSMGNRLLLPASALIALCAFVHACGGGGGGGGGNPPAPAPGPGPTGFVSTSQFPANSATNVPRQPLILIGFNDIVNPATITSTTVSLNQGVTPVASTPTYLPCNNRIQLIPDVALMPGLVYTVSLTAGLRDDDNEALTAMTFSFTTTAGADTVRPVFIQAGLMANPSPGTETNQIVLDWTDGTDAPNTANTIFYRVYVSTQPVCFDFASPAVVTGPGILQALVPGLNSRTVYSFVVRAVDAGGNESLNEAAITETTFTSLATDLFPVVSSQCASCHVPGGQASGPPNNINMNYSTAQTVFNSWVGQSSQCAGAAGAGFGIRVVSGSAATSFLWNKISGQPAVVVCGQQMPFGLPPMSAANQDIFFDWIEEGALDN